MNIITTIKQRIFARRAGSIATIIILIGTAPLRIGCGTEGGEVHEGEKAHDTHQHAEGEEGHEEHGEGNIIEIDPAIAKETGIETDVVARESIRSDFSLPAIVRPEGDGIAHVGTIVSGRVVRLSVSEGKYVSRGTTLAEIETLEIGKARAEYLNAKAREEQTRRGLERQQRLAGEQIGAERTLEAARADYDQAVAARKEAEAHLRSFSIDPSEASSSFANRMKITAPITGVISDRSVTLGEYVDLADNLFTIVNTGTIWIEAKATPEQAASLAVGGSGTARGPSGERVSGKIIFISPTVDPESKTVTVRFAAPNRDGVFRPGTFVTAEFAGDAERTGIAVPEEALEREGGRFFVYREEEPNHFERVEVEVEGEIADRAIVSTGLAEGDRIAVQGVFYLRSLRSAGELSEHHH